MTFHIILRIIYQHYHLQSMNQLPEKERFVQLIQENSKIIYKICHSYCVDKNAKDDLAQEIVYNLWKSFHTFNPDFKFSTWMYRIALNVAISFYRNENKIKPYKPYSEDLIAIETSPPEDNDNERNLNLLLSFINSLKEIDKSIMLLYLDDKSYREIAEIIGISESNVATKINRIKDKLKSNFSNTIK